MRRRRPWRPWTQGGPACRGPAEQTEAQTDQRVSGGPSGERDSWQQDRRNWGGRATSSWGECAHLDEEDEGELLGAGAEGGDLRVALARGAADELPEGPREASPARGVAEGRVGAVEEDEEVQEDAALACGLCSAWGVQNLWRRGEGASGRKEEGVWSCLERPKLVLLLCDVTGHCYPAHLEESCRAAEGREHSFDVLCVERRDGALKKRGQVALEPLGALTGVRTGSGLGEGGEEAAAQKVCRRKAVERQDLVNEALEELRCAPCAFLCLEEDLLQRLEQVQTLRKVVLGDLE